MVCMSTQQQWQEVIEHQVGNQDGGVWPGRWLLEKMSNEFDVRPLRFGDEEYGYLFWVKSQGERVSMGMKTLKGTFADFDDEVGQRLAAQARVRVLEARLAGGSVVIPEPVVVECALSEGKEGASKGQLAYEGRVSGLKWSDIGGNSSLVVARKYASSNGLPWPPAPEVSSRGRQV